MITDEVIETGLRLDGERTPGTWFEVWSPMGGREDISFGYLRMGHNQVHFVTCDTDTIDHNGNDLRFARFAVNNIADALREIRTLRQWKDETERHFMPPVKLANEIEQLKATIADLRERGDGLATQLKDWIEDSDCRLDHNEFCQEHCCELPCINRMSKAALARWRESNQ